MLTYIWKLLNDNNLPSMLLQKQQTTFITNKGNYFNQIQPILQKYNLPTNLQWIKSIKLTKWKSIVKTATKREADTWYLRESNTLKKLSKINSYKKSILREKYIENLPRAHAQNIFRLRTNMLHLKHNMKGSHKEILCPRCGTEDDTTSHLFMCTKTASLRRIYDINYVENIFNTQCQDYDLMIRISKFLERIDVT